MYYPKKNLVFQPSIFWGYVSFREGSYTLPEVMVNYMGAVAIPKKISQHPSRKSSKLQTSN